MQFKKGQRLELQITDLAFGGKGLAKPDGLAVFVDQAVPGDVAQVQIVRKKKNYAEAKVIELLELSSDRISAPCPYSGFCGGCKWQFLNYQKQLVYKQQHVIDALMHIGTVQSPQVHATIPSQQAFAYRNKMEFSCSDRRWALPHEMQQDHLDRSFALGLHVPGTFSKVIDIDACLLQPDKGNRILAYIRDSIRASNLAPYGLKRHTGFWRFVVLRNSSYYGQWMVNLVSAYEESNTVKQLAKQLVLQFPEIVSVVNNITGRKSGVAIGEYEYLMAGKSQFRERIESFEFIISANSFFQTNSLGAQTLYEIARKYAELNGNETILDLYSGTGTIAIFMAHSARQIIGIELANSAIADAERNCRLNGVDNCRFIQGDMRDALPLLTEKPHVILIDPPRAGMHKDVTQQILEIMPERIVYVSCNPASLARDVALLSENYRLVEVQPVDMFPHTYHIEAVAKLVRR
jgi:23S rRNA (uracil1939-C5)-methyltransferase